LLKGELSMFYLLLAIATVAVWFGWARARRARKLRSNP
jgi:hypothetical protein